MCKINSNIGTKCQLYFEFPFRPEVALKCHRYIILCKTLIRSLKWSICAILYFACVIPICELFYMLDKKQTNKQTKTKTKTKKRKIKRSIVTRTV